MTPNEFKFWFQGYTESMKSPPTKEQWERIKKRVAEITPTYYNYFPYYYYSTPNYQYPYYYSIGSTSGGVSQAAAANQYGTQMSQSNGLSSGGLASQPSEQTPEYWMNMGKEDFKNG